MRNTARRNFDELKILQTQKKIKFDKIKDEFSKIKKTYAVEIGLLVGVQAELIMNTPTFTFFKKLLKLDQKLQNEAF